MNDPAEEIADALVEYIDGLNDQDPSVVSLNAQVRKTDNPLGELKAEILDLTVLIFAAEEAEEKMGRSSAAPYLEEYTVAAMFVRTIDAEFTREKLARYVREVKRACRGVKMAEYTYSRAETPVKFDTLIRKELGLFVCSVHFNYLSMG